MRITLVGGPTALIEFDGFRLLSDPTFDPAGREYTRGPVTLRKTADPVLAAKDLEPIDVVLLSHDQHADNLDDLGRQSLQSARTVFVTPSGAGRLGSNAVGLAPWQTAEFRSADGTRKLQITATPARHGPPGIEPVSGEVTGFVVESSGNRRSAIYLTGDTVWFEGVAEVAKRFPFPTIRTILLFAGAARVKGRGLAHLTMNTDDALATALAFPDARIVPVHYEGWEHFSEGKQDLSTAFSNLGLDSRLTWLTPGVPQEIVTS